MFHADGAVEMQVKVSDKAGIQAYGFAYSGVAVPMKSGSGKFFASATDQNNLLEWVMIGDPGGTMKVVVTRVGDGGPVAERDTSTIPPPKTKGYDALQIVVADA